MAKTRHKKDQDEQVLQHMHHETIVWHYVRLHYPNEKFDMVYSVVAGITNIESQIGSEFALNVSNYQR